MCCIIENQIWLYPLAPQACPLINARVGTTDAKYCHIGTTALCNCFVQGSAILKEAMQRHAVHQGCPKPTSTRPYLGRGAGGEVGQVPDPGGRPRVAGADEDGGTDLHGVPVAGSLGGLVRHAEGGEGVALLGILLALRLPLGCPSRPGAGQHGAWRQACRCRRCHCHCLCWQRHVAAGSGSWARLVHLDELLGGFIQLCEEEKGKIKKD